MTSWTRLVLATLILTGCGKIGEETLASVGGSSLFRLDASVPSTANVNQCVPVILSLLNAAGTPIKAPMDLTIGIGGAGPSELFSDSTCATAAPATASWAKDQSSVALFVKPANTSIYTLQFTEPTMSVLGLFKILTVTSGVASAEDLRLALGGPASLLTGQCKAFTVEVQTTAGASRKRTSATPITLSGLGAGSAFAGTACAGSPVTALTLPANAAVVSFSLLDTTAENLILVVDTTVSGLASDFHNIEIASSAAYEPKQLSLSGVSSVTAGACAGPVLMRALDSFGNNATTTANLPFTLSGNLGFTAFADAGCLTPLVAPQIASGASAMNFYFQTSAGGTLTITGDDGGPLLDTSLTVTSNASTGGSASRLAVTGPSTLTVGSCSSSYLVKTQDNSNVDYAVASTTTVNLMGKGVGDFYADAGCTSPISALTFAPGDNVKPFYYKSNSTGSLVFNADDAGPLTPGSQSVNIVAGPATKLAITGSSPISASACRTFVVATQDAGSHATDVSASTPIDLSETGTGMFYSDAVCATATTSVNIQAGQSNAVFYYKSPNAGSTTLTTASLSGLTMATYTLVVQSLPAAKLAMTRPTLRAGTCTPITIAMQDSLGGNVNTAAALPVTLAGVASGAFYPGAACAGGTQTTSTTIASGTSSQTVYFLDNSAETLTMTANASGLTGDAWTATVTPGVPNRLTLAGPASIAAGSCVAVSVYARDAQSNLSPLTSGTLITFTGAGAGKFSAQGDCSSASSSLTMPAGQSSAAVYYVNASSQTVTLQASASGLTAGTLAVTVNAGGETKTKWTLASSTAAGTCLTGALQVQDALGNAVPQAAARSINLGDLGSAQVYTSVDCSGGSVTSLTVPMSTSSVSFTLKDTVAEALVMTASSAGLSAITQALTVAPGAPARLTLNGLAAINAGDCAAFDVRVEDTLGNLSPVSASATVNFAGLANGRAYSDSSCGSQITATTMASGAAQKTVYVKDTFAEALTLTASATGLSTASKSVTVLAQPATNLVITGPSSGPVASCQALQVHVRDQLGNEVSQGAALTVDLLGAGSGAFYSDAGCTTSTTQVTVAMATSFKAYYFKSSVAESLQFRAQNSLSGLQDGTKSFVSQPLVPSVISFTGLSTINAATCSGYTISLVDALGNLAPVGSSKTISLAGSGAAGSFYADAACTSSITSTIFTSSQTSQLVYYKATGAQTPTLVIDDVGLPNLPATNFALTVNASGTGTTLALRMNGASSLQTNVCSPYAVTSVDPGGASVNVTSNLAVNLAGAGTGGFYSDSACGTASSTATIATGTSLVYAYFKAAAAQNLVLSATSVGASSTTLPISVTAASSATTAAKLAWSGTTSFYSQSCIPLLISLTDANGNSINATASVPVTLGGMGAGTFYTNDTCTTSAGAATSIGSGTSFTTVYFKTPNAANLVFIAQSSGLSNGTWPVNVSAPGSGNTSGPAVKLAFVQQPSATATVSVSFDVQPIVAVQDSNNGVVSGASSPITLVAYSDAACTTPAGGTMNATNNPLSASGGVANFAGLNETGSQTIYLKATSSGLASACSAAVQVYPSVPSKLAFSTQPSAMAVAGATWSTQPQVSVLNYTGQVMTSSTNAVTISAYSDGSCSTAVSTGTFAVDSNPVLPNSGIVAYSGVSDTLATTIYLKAESPGLAATCSTGVTIAPAGAHHLSFLTQPASTVIAGGALTAQVRLQDAFNNTAPGSDTIKLTAYPSSNCTGTALTGFTNNSLAASLGTSSFTGVSETVAGVMSIKANDTTTPAVLEVCSTSITVSGAAAQTLAFTTQPSATGFSYSNLLTSPVVTVFDSYGNIASSASAPITLAAYSDASCTTAASASISANSNPLAPNAGVATFSGVFYPQQAMIYIRAAASGLGSACSTAVAIGGVVSQLAVGGTHTCALSNSNVFCWGANHYGQLGIGTRTGAISTPIAVVGVGGTGLLSNIVAISASGGDTTNGGHTCAVGAGGELYCWGSNSQRQLGDGTTTMQTAPVRVLGVGGVGYLSNVAKVSAGGDGQFGYTCAADTAGSAYCWGFNTYGQLGDGSSVTRATPVQVRGVGGVGNLTNVIDISAATKGNSDGNGYMHTCAATASGAAYCWGYGGVGQLGNNVGGTSATPVQVVGVGGTGMLANIMQVSTAAYGTTQGYGHTCARASTGAVYCWGYNSLGQLGDNTATQRSAPVQVVGLNAVGFVNDATKIVTGGDANNYANSCIVSTGGTASCWGYMFHGGIALSPTSTYSPKPVLGVGGTGTLGNLINIATSNTTSGMRTCAVNNLGAVYCFGDRSTGGIGDGSTQSNINQYSPVQTWATGAVSFSQLVTSGSHTCGIVAGTVYCWGANGSGQVGDGTTTDRNVPTAVLGVGGVGTLNNIVSLAVAGGDAATYGWTCAVSASGQAYCWGTNVNGQLGVGSTTNQSFPVQISSLSNVTKISASGNYYGHTCALTSVGNAYCWGSNAYAQLGDGTTTLRSSPVQVPLSNVVDIAAAGNSASTSYQYGHTCAALGNGSLYCWGYGDYGQTGVGTATTPTLVPGISDVVQVSAAISYLFGVTCAVTSTGGAYCMGYNNYYWVGDGTTTQRLAPTRVVGIGGSGYLSGVTKISTALYSSTTVYGRACAVTTSGTVCWGQDGYYGTGNYPDSSVSTAPTLIKASRLGFQSISVGENLSCGVTTTGSGYCWGYSANGAAGTGSNPPIGYYAQMVSSPLPTGLSIASIAAGQNQTCAAANGNAYCWGAGTNGALGNGALTNVTDTAQVRGTSGGILGISSVASGGTQGCALTASGTVTCWGDNYFGDLGNNTTTTSLTAVNVLGAGGIGNLGSVSSLAAGYRHICAVSSGQVYCWGWDGSGQLGNNSTISSATPLAVVGVGASGYLSGMTKVVTGYSHSCSLSTGGEVYCWGNNTYGQLGNASTSSSNTPVKVLNVAGNGSLTGVTAIAAGAYHTCGISGGQVFCWGSNSNGQLGNDTTTSATYPVGTLTSGFVGLTGMTGISGGNAHSCAVSSAKTVYCWGANSNGQLGNNTYSDARTAVQVVGVGGTGNLTGISLVTAGATGQHTCALSATGGSAFCWGKGNSGQLGNNTTPSGQPSPVASIVANIGVSYFIAR